MKNAIALIAPARQLMFKYQRRCSSGATFLPLPKGSELVAVTPETAPAAVAPYEGLPISQRRLLQFLDNWAFLKRPLPTFSTIASMLRNDAQTVRRASIELEQAGIIKVERGVHGAWLSVTLRTGQVIRRGGATE